MGVYKLPNGGYKTTYDEKTRKEVIEPRIREARRLLYDFLEIQGQLNQSVTVDALKAAVYQETGTPLVLIDEAFEDLLELKKIIVDQENENVELKE